MRIAVIGAGWAGLAAAVALTQARNQVTVLESARTVGGRARRISGTSPDGTELPLDNGQHILIGAYAQTLSLMRTVGVDVDGALLRSPLALTYVDGSGLKLPDLPPPWDALAGVLHAKGWAWLDKLALLRTCAAWQIRGFRCDARWSVAQLCQHLRPRLQREFIEPLCVSALNTPAHEASAQVFLRVLRDSLFSGRGGSNLLLPRTDLGTLFPEVAARWLADHGATIQTGQRVQQLQHLHANGSSAWDVDGARYDAVVLAAHSTESARLVAAALPTLPHAALAPAQRWIATAQALRFTAIATVYAMAHCKAGSERVLKQPMLALRSNAGEPAQFVFDRGQLGGPAGLLAFVVSASERDRAALEQQVLLQAQNQLGLSGLTPVQTVIEKRATFACTPAVERPESILMPTLCAAGDYTEGPYPATLEGAIRSGLQAANHLASSHIATPATA